MKVLGTQSCVDSRRSLGDGDGLPRPGSDSRGRDRAGAVVLGETAEDPVALFNEDLHDNILKLDIQHGRHRLLLRPHESGAEYHRHIGGCHQVFLAVTAHVHQMFKQHLQHFSIFLW